MSGDILTRSGWGATAAGDLNRKEMMCYKRPKRDFFMFIILYFVIAHNKHLNQIQIKEVNVLLHNPIDTCANILSF